LFLILLVMRPVKVVYDWCQRWLPSNRLVHLVRARRGLRWGIPLVLLGAGYFAVGVVCAGIVQAGGPGRWYLPMLVCWWTAIKVISHGLYATITLPIVRASENLAIRRAIREASTQLREPRQVWTRGRRRQLTREVRRDLTCGSAWNVASRTSVR
jgi:hypothetical protein